MTAFRRAKGYLSDVTRGFSRAPLEMLLALYLAIAYSVAMEIAPDGMLAWNETAIPAGLILVAAWSGTLLHALGAWTQRRRLVFTTALAAVILLYAAFFTDYTKQAEAWRAATLVGAAVLWLFAVPALAQPVDPVPLMRRVDGRVILRMLAVLLYGLALFIGLTLAIAAIDNLFELHLKGRIYGHVFGWIFLVLVPWVIIGGLDDYVRPAEGHEAVASAVHKLTLYLVPPLLALYFLILYAYMVRIGVTREIPKNLVSPMVIAAAALTGIALLLFDPPPAGTRFARALRFAPVLVLPLAPVAAWALLVRLDQYGWTEFRALRLVLLGALTALALLASWELKRRRPFALHVLPLTLAGVMLLAVVGPWSTLALSRRSQQKRLADALAQVGASRQKLVSAELYDRVQGDARYLQVHFGVDALPARLRQYARASETWVDYAEALGLERAADTRVPDKSQYRQMPAGTPVELTGGTLYRVEYNRQGRPENASVLRVSTDSLKLILNVRGTVYSADLAPLFALPTSARNEVSGKAGTVEVRDASGATGGSFVLFEAGMGRDESKKLVLMHVSGVVIFTTPDIAGAPQPR